MPTLCKLGIDLSAFDGTPPEPIGLAIAGFDFFPDLQRQLNGMRRHFRGDQVTDHLIDGPA